MYYNTNKLWGYDFYLAIHRAQKQEDAVMIIFQKFNKMTASEVWNNYGKNRAPLTSIRRAITDLVSDKKLVKCSELKEGIYGRPEHYYKLF